MCHKKEEGFSMINIRKVAVGISGGVDSAVAALLLKRRGYDVHGVFMQNWDIVDEMGHCSADADYKDACYVCEKLNIALTRANFVKHYWNEVFCNLVKDYQCGVTPNPDILCNRNIKFNYFYQYAVENLKADAIATGHYARTSFGPYLQHYHQDEDVRLMRAKDTKKDQTFFLCQIKQEPLRKTMFPLGDLTKIEVKRLASTNGLEKLALKKESMGICFIGSRNFQEFIKEYIEDKPGDFVNIDNGKVVGRHNGIHQWTLGQRTRLQGCTEAFFTARKDLENNVIYVPHWIHSEPEELKNGGYLECQFKFQHTEKWVDCRVCKLKDGLLVLLEHPKRALTPGQFAVFWKSDDCLGSGSITCAGPSEFSLNYLKDGKLESVEEITKRVELLQEKRRKKEAKEMKKEVHIMNNNRKEATEDSHIPILREKIS